MPVRRKPLLTLLAEMIAQGSAGYATGGPAGAIAGGTAPIAQRALALGASEFAARVLGPEEERRIADAITYASARVKERLEAGDSIRADGFFDGSEDER